MRSKIVTSFALALLMVAGAAPSGAAPTSSSSALADGLFRDGKQLLAAGHVAEACRKFEASYRAEAVPGTLLNVALCHEQEGKTASAWVELDQVLAQTKAAPATDRKSAQRKKIAEEHLSALEPHLARLLVKIDEAASTPDLAIKVDDLPLEAAALGTRFPIDPGEHAITATASGKVPFKRSVTAREQQTLTLVIPRLEDLPAPAPARGAPARDAATPAPRVTAPPGRWKRPVGFVALGLGAVGIAFGTAFGVQALTLAQESRNQGCAETTCPTPQALEVYNRGKASARASDVTLALGIASASAGIVLLILAPPAGKRREAGAGAGTGARLYVTIAPALGREAGLGVIGGTF